MRKVGADCLLRGMNIAFVSQRDSRPSFGAGRVKSNQNRFPIGLWFLQHSRRWTMLVLSRKRQEMMQIGEGVIVKVIHIGRNTVKIGIEAPEGVRVVRGELFGSPGRRNPLASFLRERSVAKAARREGRKWGDKTE
ncbi:MAG TPA: carbon storage regulator [Planctomycetaceae bacterium]|nr:carbon storage regulator [Planctomycetaceae bacterium]